MCDFGSDVSLLISMYHRLAVFGLLLVFNAHCDGCKSEWEDISDKVNTAIHALGWEKVAIIHDDEHALILHKFLHIELMYYQININSTVGTILKEIHAEMFPDINIVLVVEDANFLKTLIKEADGFDFRTNHATDWSHHSKWLVVSSEATRNQLARLHIQNLQNIALLIYKETIFPISVSTHSFILDVDGYKLQPADKGAVFTDNGVVFTDKGAVFTDKGAVFTDKGAVFTEKGAVFTDRMFPNTKYRYNRRSLRVSTVESRPFVIASATTNEDVVPYSGYCMDILRTIAGHLNLTLHYVEAQNGVWGWINDGMVGQLRNQEIDLIASELVVHATRAKHIDYIWPALQVEDVILLYKMSPATESILLLVQPFQASVYFTYGAATVAVIAVLILMETYGKLVTYRKRVSQLCWVGIKSSLKQGDSSIHHMNVSSRLLLTFWCLLVIITSGLYSANLIATLTASSPLKKFESVDEVVRSDYSIGLLGGGILEHLVKTSPSKDVKNLYAKIRLLNYTDPRVTSTDMDSHVQRVKNGSYAFVIYKLAAENLITHDCTMAMLYFNDIQQVPATFAAQKNSPFKDDINTVMYHLKSAGLLDKMWKRWTNHTARRDCQKKRRSVTVTELIGVTVLIGAGIGVALIALFMECLAAHFVKPISTRCL